MLSPLLLHKSVTIIYLLLSESHHHLTPSNVTSKLTTLPRPNAHHLATTPHLGFNFIYSGAIPYKKAVIALHKNAHLRAIRDVTCHMGSHTVTCHPTHSSERVPPNPSHAGWYSIYLPRRDGRLS